MLACGQHVVPVAKRSQSGSPRLAVGVWTTEYAG